jgi:hypothetical protein
MKFSTFGNMVIPILFYTPPITLFNNLPIIPVKREKIKTESYWQKGGEYCQLRASNEHRHQLNLMGNSMILTKCLYT